ncbi:MAG: cell division protein FtsQ/DivIB [Pseudomonadota bacterium]
MRPVNEDRPEGARPQMPQPDEPRPEQLQPAGVQPDDGRDAMGGEAPRFLARAAARQSAAPLEALVETRARQRVVDALREGLRGRKPAGLGPGPSKAVFRLRRAWAKPVVRSALLVYLPLTALAVIGWRVVSDDGLRQAAEARALASWEALAARPEFALEGLVVTGVGPRLQGEVQRALALRAGSSSLGLDVEALRARVLELGGVEDAAVQIDPAGVLRVTVTPRPAVALWRDRAGGLFGIADDGTMVVPVAHRGLWPELPVLIGDGAEGAVGEALEILATAPELAPRLRAFVRVGERRWDMVLDREMRVMLPEDRPAEALARIRARTRDEIFERAIAVIDLRLPDRPTLRLDAPAIDTMRIDGLLKTAEDEET